MNNFEELNDFIAKRDAGVMTLLNEGLSTRAVSDLTGVPKSTVWDIKSRHENAVQVTVEPQNELPKVLFIDIETSPTLSWTWRRFKENISQAQVESECYVLTWSAKWLGQSNVVSDSLHFYPDNLNNEDDQPLIASIYDLIDEADVVVGHNGDRFDLALLNARMVYHGFTPPSPYRTVDTLKILKNKFKFPSNKLDSVCQYLGIGEKVETGGFNLWKRCMHKDVTAFEEMLEYNVYDVVLLEMLYKRIAPWYSTHVNLAQYVESDDMLCAVCTSDDLEAKGRVNTNISTFQAYRCNNCGHWHRGRINIKTEQQMENTLVNA